jgi:replicative DNA helicase
MTKKQEEKLIALIQNDAFTTNHKIYQLMSELENLRELPEMAVPIPIIESILIEESKRSPQFISENRVRFLDDAVLAITGAFFKKEVVVIAGRPGMGKTQLLVHWANLIAKNQRVLFHSLDCTIAEITNRFLANTTGVSMQHIHENKLSEQQIQSLNEGKETLKDKGLFLVDASIRSLNNLKSYYREVIPKHNIEVVFLDYIQLFSDYRGRNREQEIAGFMRTVKELAKELNVCIFLASQLSRSVETRGGDHRPILSDLRESGAIEEFSDKVFFIYRPEYYGISINEEGESTINRVEIIIAKNNLYGMNILLLERDDNFTQFNCKTSGQTDLTWDYKVEGLE